MIELGHSCGVLPKNKIKAEGLRIHISERPQQQSSPSRRRQGGAGETTEPVHSRRQGDVGGGDDQDAVGPDQGGRVAGHHPQAHQELPWSGPAHSPDTYDLIG